MFAGRRLALSLPATALVKPPAALLSMADVLAMPLAAALARAVRLVGFHARAMAEPPLVVARPEMFLEGETLAWLRAHTAGVEEHVGISDGAVVKAIPGLANHVLFVGLDTAAGEARFDRLVARAATVFEGVDSQLDGARAIRSRRHSIRLPSTALAAPRGEGAGDGGFRRFYYNLHSNEESRAWIAGTDPLGWEDLAGFDAVTVLPLAGALLAEQAYREWLAALVAETYYRPERCLLLQLPAAESEAGSADGLDLLLDALRASGRLLPRMLADNILLTDELPATAPLRYFRVPCTLLLTDASPLWAYAPDDYAVFEHVRILARRGRIYRAQYAAMAARVLGRAPDIAWLERAA